MKYYGVSAENEAAVEKDLANGLSLSEAKKNIAGSAAYESRLANMDTTQPLSAITTDGAASTLQKKVDTLNAYSPETAPGYVPPPPVETKGDAAAGKVLPPKAYFVNDAGQEAEYTQAQLDTPETQKFIKEGGYAMTKTEGPTALSGEVSGLDKQISDLISSFNNYNVDSDPSFSAQANAIRGQYNDLREEVKKSEEIYGRSMSTSMSRYTPGSAADYKFTVADQATKALGSILRKEQSAVGEARTAYQAGQYSKFNTLLGHIEKLRDDKAATLKEITTTLNKSLEETRKKNVQATRDAAIGGIMQQGITDPKEILALLNYDDKGNMIGDFSAKEVADTLKSLTDGKAGWQDKLSGSTRDFYILKDQGQLPANITGLPDDQQLFAYLKAEKVASTIGGKGNPLTLSEVLTLRKQGIDIPLSMVGKDQDSFNETLTQDAPPDWFVEKAEKELQMSLTPDSAQKAWEEYKKTNIDSLGIPDEKQSNDFKKARQYFGATYDGLSDSQLDEIATQVETYVNGGMSYADAVAQTIKDID